MTEKTAAPRAPGLNALDKAADGLSGFMDHLIERRLSLTLSAFIVGFCMIMAAAVLQIGSVTFDGKLANGFDVFASTPVPAGATKVAAKEVGYFLSLNWSLFGIILMPLIVWFGLELMQSMRTTLESLGEQGMLRDGGFRRLGTAEIDRLWQSHLRANRALFFFVFALIMAFGLYDWWSVVGSPILHPELFRRPLSDPSMEYDWSVASIMAGSHVDRIGLFVFGLVGYIFMAGLAPAFALSVAMCALHFMVFLTAGRVGKARIELSVLPLADDNHFGLRLFSGFFNNLLLGSIFILLTLWLMMTQNIYLRDITHADFAGFLLEDAQVAYRIVSLQEAPKTALHWLLHPSLTTYANTQTTFAMLLFPFVCVVAIGSCWFLLRNAAIRARDFSLAHAAELAAEQHTRKARITESLNRPMSVWPVGRIQINELIAIMLVLFGSLVSYRLIVLPIAWMLVKGVKTLLTSYLKKP